MKFIDNLYYGELVKNKPDRFKKKIKKGSLFTGAYVVCLPENKDEPLEYYSARLLKQDYYKRHDITVLGIAADETEAIGIVNDIVKDCIDKTGTLNLREFAEFLTSGTEV